ncbi:iron-containing alcohol dehydrogenase [Aspergillus clavatus NRRL 1]|uniref:Fe-containing alcohol dehydrogenase, putative n=1 Tax=Aspergillus clavatus (strain ATCC 1007 / CBS 513.65 / DSM 816 / NCTC 3887 / NRRL 1 / QM 1276 / 107) TaxID=344612 RepID=A1CQY1_ASPCL|nr:Fe-containing alcohol dehydrogenase, putative [Aspergillus clavatus NRRL 1]EAW08052.1 Fe-containing alcohol dehydrogenase, putative [Aspergillus clavatus NRRL 1]
MPETVRPAFADRARPLLSYGIPFPAAAAHHIANTFAASRVYVICSASLARNTDALDRLVAALGPDKVVGRRIGMKSHTLWSEVLEVVEDARRVEADLLLTLGAGSLTDGAKVAALALANNVQNTSGLASLAQGPEERADAHPPTVPIISIPTSLSAGEYSNFAGATDDATHQKHMFRGPTRGPQLVILDPALATTTPDAIWLSTGIRAVDHCVETLCATTGTTDASDQHAMHALRQLVPGLLRCRRDRADPDAHLLCQLGSVDAMAALTSGAGGGGVVELGASHGIGHQLGPLGVGHGETSCILLPAVCKFNAKYGANGAQQERAVKFLVRDEEVVAALRRRGVDAETADLGDVLDVVVRELGMPRSLKDVGVGRDALDALAANSLHDHWCKTNPVPLLEKEQVLEILEMVVE